MKVVLIFVGVVLLCLVRVWNVLGIVIVLKVL